MCRRLLQTIWRNLLVLLIEEGSRKSLRNLGNRLPDCTMSHPRKPKPKCSPKFSMFNSIFVWSFFFFRSESCNLMHWIQSSQRYSVQSKTRAVYLNLAFTHVTTPQPNHIHHQLILPALSPPRHSSLTHSFYLAVSVCQRRRMGPFDAPRKAPHTTHTNSHHRFRRNVPPRVRLVLYCTREIN
jgi:hypothetical protein